MKVVKDTGRTRRKTGPNRGGGYRYMRGKLYARYQYTDSSGKLRDKVRAVATGKISDVWPIVEQMKRELRDGGEEMLHADKVTFDQLADAYLESKVQPAVIRGGRKVSGLKSYKPVRTYVEISRAHFGRTLIRSIKVRDIEAFREIRLRTPVERKVNTTSVPQLNPLTKRMRKSVTSERKTSERKLSSVNREMATLRRMLNFAVSQDWLLQNPFEKGDKLISNAAENVRDRVLGWDEEVRLLAECRDEREHLRAILICALDTAMRPEEIFSLRWSDVDVITGVIVIRAENTKNETARTVGLTQRLTDELTGLWSIGPKQMNGSVFGVKSVKTGFRTACREAEIRDFKFRDCRHTATTRMVNSGLPHAEIMKVTGHTQLKTFLRYVNLTPQSVSENAKRFGEFVTGKQFNVGDPLDDNLPAN